MSDTNDSERDVRTAPTQGHRHIYPLHTSLPLLMPRLTLWRGITIEHHLQPPAECEMCLPQHTVCILLRECQTERQVKRGRLHLHHVSSGQLLVYPATSDHWIRWQEQAEFLLLLLDPNLVTQVADELASRTTVEIIESEQARDDLLMQQIALALKAEIEEGMVASSSLYADSLANTLTVHLLRHYAVWKPRLRETRGSHAASTLRRVMEYIHDNLDKPLTLAELSFVADMSPSYFSHTFKQVTGETPHHYVLAARIERAKSLLLRGNWTPAQVASNIGFFDQSHFTRAFKQLVGVTPHTFLQQNSKNLPE